MSVKLVQVVSQERDLIQGFVQAGLRVFEADQARGIADNLGIDPNYFIELMGMMIRDGWLHRIKKGVYFLEVNNTGIPPIHEFELAMYIVQPSTISHYSAFRHHGLTEQLPKDVFITTIKETKTPQRGKGKRKAGFELNDINYRIFQIKKDKFFGFEKKWIGGGGWFNVTDLERTLLDGLAQPQYCGGFSEVMHAIEENAQSINLEKIIQYALNMDIAVSRRLGWALEEVGIFDERISELAQTDRAGYRRLDPSQEAKGSYVRKWRLQINI